MEIAIEISYIHKFICVNICAYIELDKYAADFNI